MGSGVWAASAVGEGKASDTVRDTVRGEVRGEVRIKLMTRDTVSWG